MQYFSKNILVILFLALAIIGGSFFISKQNSSALLEKTGAGQLLSADTADKEKDSDGDGLPDWEEELLGTDPENPDTDGDGILDGIQYKSEKKYPAIELEMRGALDELRGGGISGNITDTLFREAGARYGILGQGETLGEKEKGQIVNSLVQNLSLKKPPPRYTHKDISIAKNSDTASVQAYAKKMTAAFIEHQDIYESDPLALINTSFDIQGEDSLKKLSDLQNSYFTLASKLGAIEVPPGLTTTHVELLNNIYKTGQVLESMQTVFLDPVQSMLATANYLHYRNARAQIMPPLLDYLEQHFMLL